jgi:hypothetical protein
MGADGQSDSQIRGCDPADMEVFGFAVLLMSNSVPQTMTLRQLTMPLSLGAKQGQFFYSCRVAYRYPLKNSQRREM